MKIFITGVYGSGKTTLANRISNEKGVQYISFDNMFDYSKKGEDIINLTKSIYKNVLGDKDFVIDAIPYGKGGVRDLSIFLEYYDANKDTSIMLTYCNYDVWLKRLFEVRKYKSDALSIKLYKYHFEAVYANILEKISDKISSCYNSVLNRYEPDAISKLMSMHTTHTANAAHQDYLKGSKK